MSPNVRFACRGNSGRSALAVPPGRPAMRTRKDRGEGIGPERTSRGPLSGLMIRDLTSVLSGPFADDDDELRASGGYFQSINRNMRSMEINLKTGGSRGAVLQLVMDTEGLVEKPAPRRHGWLGVLRETQGDQPEARIRRHPWDLGSRRFNDPQVHSRDMLVALGQPRSPSGVTVVGSLIRLARADRRAVRRTPLPGEHAEEVLAP